jgi:flagellin
MFRGSMGEDIRLNIQVAFNPETGQFEFPNGTAIDELGVGGTYAGGLHMSKDFRTFGPIMLQIGPSHNTAMPVQIPRLNAETLGLMEYVGGVQRLMIDVRPTAVVTPGGGVRQVGAEAAINTADLAIQTISNTRARLGAYQNRLESTVRNLDVAAENTEISRSRIQDTDMARETTRFAQYNVMFQAAMSLLGQANQRPQQIIQLLQ